MRFGVKNFSEGCNVQRVCYIPYFWQDFKEAGMQHYTVPVLSDRELPRAAPDGALPVGVVMLDASGQIMTHNALAERLISGLYSGAPWREVQAQSLIPLPGDGCEFSTLDGRLVRVSTMRHQSGEETLVLTPLSLNRAEYTRNQRLQKLGEQLAGLMHQLRTPLTGAIFSAAQLRGADTAGVLRIHARLQACLQSLHQQIEDTLRFARGEVLVREAVSLEHLSQHVKSLVEPEALLKGAVIRVEQMAKDASASLALESFSGAIANLVKNALEANAREIVLTFEQTAQYVCIVKVQDNGDGMPQAVRNQAFTPFFTTRANGTGLGLALVQAVVEAHGGFCAIETDSRQGTCIIVKIP
ncbi:HAMP domain-containing histidine kinase [Legionella geestiana]|nr:HAMP domain-containing histidine kinase [Legionella geestiana]